MAPVPSTEIEVTAIRQAIVDNTRKTYAIKYEPPKPPEQTKTKKPVAKPKKDPSKRKTKEAIAVASAPRRKLPGEE